jgi:hypothetical protein
VGYHVVRHLAGETHIADGRTMFLPAGMHELKIRNHNVAVDLSLEIVSIGIYAPGGEDLDENGMADWLDRALAPE